MSLRLATLALGVAAVGWAGAARAEPEVLVKCDTPGIAQKFTRDGGWKPYPNPDRSIVITRDKGKLGMELTGDNPISSRAVLALPQHAITTFRVLGHNGVQNFHVVLGLYSGKPELKHSIFGAKDGSGVFHMEDYTLANCSVVGSDVLVEKEVAGPPATPKP
jgi:hypothetical protein